MSLFSQQTDSPKLTGPYLGQRLPGKTVQQFAVNVFDSTYQGFHSNIIFSPDGNAAFWQLNKGHGSKLQGIFESRYENGIWTKPQVAFFSTLVAGGMDDAPFISPDGKKFFFLSYRPVEKGKESDILQGDCPLVTTDGKYLFFRDDLNGSLRPFWIDAGFIEELRPKRAGR
jgi:hypothetical protein